MIDLLFDCTGGHQSIDLHLALLSKSPCPLTRLHISRRIPVRIVDDNAISTCQVDTETTDFGRQKEHVEVLVTVELIHKRLSIFDRGVAIHAAVIETRHSADEAFKDVQHDPVLREE